MEGGGTRGGRRRAARQRATQLLALRHDVAGLHDGNPSRGAGPSARCHASTATTSRPTEQPSYATLSSPGPKNIRYSPPLLRSAQAAGPLAALADCGWTPPQSSPV